MHRFKDFLEKIIKYIVLNMLVLEILSLIPYILYPFIDGNIYEENIGYFSLLELKIYYFFQDIYVMTLLFYPYVSLVIIIFFVKMKNISIISFKIGGKKHIFRLSFPSQEILSKRSLKILFITSIIIIFISCLYPYSPKINPEQRPVGVDIIYYYKWLKYVDKNNDLIKNAFSFLNGSRPLYLISTYCIKETFKIDPLILNEIYIPIILYLMLILSIYYMSYKITKRYDIAVLTSFFTATGYQITIGIYSAFYANLFALSLLYLSIALILDKSNKHIFFSYILLFLLIFIHPWTLIQGTIFLFILSIINCIDKEIDKRFLKVTITLLISLIFIFVSLKTFLGLSGIISALINTGKRVYINPWRSFKEMEYMTKILYGGFIANPLTLLIFLIPFIVLTAQKKLYKVISAWTFTLLPIISYDNVIQSRLYFNYPIGMVLAIIIIFIFNCIKSPITKKIFLAYIIVLSLNYLLRCLANLYFLYL